jgi:hypothetical protein
VPAGVATREPDEALGGHPERRIPPARRAGLKDGHGRPEGADLISSVGRNPGSDPLLEGGKEPAREGGVRREEMKDHLRVADEPGRDSGVQVGHPVVRKEVNPPAPGDPGRHVLQEPEPVADPILRGGAEDHPDDRRQGDGIAGRHGGRPLAWTTRLEGRDRPLRADHIPAHDQGAVQGAKIAPQHIFEAGGGTPAGASGGAAPAPSGG